MIVLCKGFNLYWQLDQPELLLDEFTQVFADSCIKEICINHSFSIFQNSNSECTIFQKNKSKSFSDWGNIIKISSNDERVLILNNVGKLFKLELRNVDLVLEITNIFNSKMWDEQIINISSGFKLSIAYTSKGRVYNIPYELNFKNVNIIDIKCGREHCVLLDTFGNIYTFGRGSRGQLGHGRLDDELEPLQVERLAGIKIVQIAAGGWHSCAVSKDGDLYTWGWNGNGQLGLGTKDEDKQIISMLASPSVVDFSDPRRNTLKVACGCRHTIVLLDNGHLVGCGWNKYKQLASENKENFFIFTYLHAFSSEEVFELKCGPWNSIVICK